MKQTLIALMLIIFLASCNNDPCDGCPVEPQKDTAVNKKPDTLNNVNHKAATLQAKN